MKNIMKEAHNLTKKIIKAGDNYKATFRLCLIFVHSQIKKGVEKMIELKGTEKQVKWANDIRSNIITVIEKVRDEKVNSIVGDKVKKSGKILTEVERRNTHIKRFEKALEIIKNETSSEYFINNSTAFKSNFYMNQMLENSKYEELNKIASYFQNFTKSL